MDVFGQRLTLLRKALDVSQKEVARNVNISQGTYSGYERGNPPSVDTLIALARYFNVSTDYLLGLSAQSVNRSTQPDQLLARLGRIPMPQIDTAPSQTAVIALINAVISYRAAGSPMGDTPLMTAGAVINATTDMLDASSSQSLATMLDAANALAAAALSASDILKIHIEKANEKEPIDA